MTKAAGSGSLTAMVESSDEPLQFEPDGAEEYEAGVSRALAASRSRRISELRYDLELGLDAGLTRLSGRARIRLRLADDHQTAPVVLDFRDLTTAGRTIDGSIAGLKVNGRFVTDHRLVNGHLLLPASHFQAGENEISVDFESVVALAGRPLISFEDQADGSRFVYLLSVPMDASLAFPCFDQPDLKGSFTLSLTVPAGMAVISNSEPCGEPTAEDERVRHRFEPTPPLSTYLFSFAVGPFAKLESHLNGHPLRLFVRQSQLARAESEWPAILGLTASGISYLSDYLGYDFPFGKYDQVLLPGFPFRGMEHAGATFLREEAVLLGATPGPGEMVSRAALILHELVHQWFGDLVTMRWFDDLWIKEGFANLLAYTSLASIRPFGLDEREVWKCFYLAHKPGASAIDRTTGTTPIHQSIPNLGDARSAYGAIVYQKAPMILRALSFSLGAETFQRGVRRFLRRHAFDAADWRDLISSFEEVSGRTLRRWSDAWILGSGLPCVETEWKLASGAGDNRSRLTVRLTQRDPQGGQRSWPIEALVRIVLADGSSRSLRTSFDGPSSSLIEIDADTGPRFIFSNDEGLGYGSFLPDQQSLDALIEEVDTTDDPLDRILFRGAIDDAFAEGRLSPVEYLEMLQRSIAKERDEGHLNWLLERLIEVTERHIEVEAVAGSPTPTEKLLLSRMDSAVTKGENLLLLRAFRRLATTTEGAGRLREMLAACRRPGGATLAPADRWAIIATLLSLGDPKAEQLFEEERLNDQSESAAKLAWITAAARPDAATKASYFRQYLHPGEVAEDWVEGSLTNFNHRHQSGLTIEYLLPALAALPQLKRQRKIFFILAWLNAFIGGHPAARALPIVDDFLHRYQIDRDLISKILQVADPLRRPVS